MKQRFIIEIENDTKISRSSVEESIIKEIKPWNVRTWEETK